MHGRFDMSRYLVPPTIQTTMDSSMWSENIYFDPLIHVSWLFMTKKRDYYVHNGRIGLFILSWSTITGYSASILSQLAKNWLVSDSSFFDSWLNISVDIQWHRIPTRWITLHYDTRSITCQLLQTIENLFWIIWQSEYYNFFFSFRYRNNERLLYLLCSVIFSPGTYSIKNASARRPVPSKSPKAVRYGIEKLSGSLPRLHK